MKNVLTLIIIGILSTLSANAVDLRTDQQTIDWFRETSVHIPIALIQRGQPVVGKLDLKKIVKDAKRIKWELNKGNPIAGSGDYNRIGGFNVLGKVIINEQSLPRMGKSSTLAIGLHELLGALGYEDENFELTGPLFILALSDREEVAARMATRLNIPLLPQFQNVTIRKENKLYSKGGVTGVGGGGEGMLINIKMRLFSILEATPDSHLIGLGCDQDKTLLMKQLVMAQIENSQSETEELPKVSMKDGKLFMWVASPNWTAYNLRPSPSTDRKQNIVLRSIFEQICALKKEAAL